MFSPLASWRGLVLEHAEADRLNLDGRKQLLKLPASEKTCTQLLEAGNLYGDIVRSLGATRRDGHGQDAQRCYGKLLCSSNLPSIAPVGE